MNIQKLDEITKRYEGNNLAKQFYVHWVDAQGKHQEHPFKAITTGGAIDRITYTRDKKDTTVGVADRFNKVFCILKDK